MTEMRARLVDKDGNPLGTAANPLKISGDVGGGVPDGGTTGQVLQKKSDADQDVEWGDGSGASTAWGSITGTLSDQTDLGAALDGKASRTDSDLTLYVYEDATGTGDGSSKANGFTTLQAAIDAIPDVAQNVTIIVSKGSTNYLGQTTTIQKASVKSLTIRGEYYWYANCDANAVAGKIVDSDIDTTGMEVGDRVVCMKYSGTVGSSAIVDYFYATITEVGEGYVQTSEETKVPTTGWRYLINQTVFDGNNGWNIVIHILTPDLLTKTLGLSIINVNARAIAGRPYVDRCIIYDIYGISANPEQGLIIDSAIFVRSGYTGGAITLGPGALSVSKSVFAAISGTVTGIAAYDFGRINCYYSGFFGLYKALDSRLSTCNIYCATCYIDSSCTYGAYGYNITLTNCTNNAATPVYDLTSGGSIKEWDGQALPSINSATGGQVLALKSDKSALEFATVDLDTLGAASSTTATQSIYVDKAATGTGTGVDWTNAFTTIQAAINSLPAIINHAVTIYIRKGSTAYSDASVLQRVVAGGSVTIRGEYYWVNQAASNSTANRLYKASADDWTGIESGDAVYLLQYSGTYEASAPTIAYVGTVDSIAGLGSGYVTISCPVGSVTPTTGWKYVITKTVISGTLTAQNIDAVTIKGLTFTAPVMLSNSRNSFISECNITANGSPYSIGSKSVVTFLNTYFGNTGASDGMLTGGSVLELCKHCFFEKPSTAGRSLLRISNTSELKMCRYTYISGRSGVNAQAAILLQMNSHAYILDTKIAYCDIGITVSYMSGCLNGGNITNGATTPEYGSGTNGCLIY